MKIISGKKLTMPRVLVYGPEGIGKSTFAAGAVDPIFVQTEDGLDNIDCNRFELATSYHEVLNQLDYLIEQEHKFRTVVIDSLDWLEKHLWKQICSDNGVESIEKVLGGYGKGYILAIDYWSDILQKLDVLRARKNMSCVLIAHHKIEKFEEPGEPSFDRYSPRLNKHALAYVTEWCDLVGFLHLRIHTPKKEAKGHGQFRNIAHKMASRVLEVAPGPCWVAKNRYGLDSTIEKDVRWETMSKEIKERMNNG